MDTKTLIITFKDAEGNAKNFSIANPKDGVTKQEVESSCTEIIGANVLETEKGGAIATLSKAQIVTKNTTDLV